jgi:hypothetical protein
MYFNPRYNVNASPTLEPWIGKLDKVLQAQVQWRIQLLDESICKIRKRASLFHLCMEYSGKTSKGKQNDRYLCSSIGNLQLNFPGIEFAGLRQTDDFYSLHKSI